MLGEVCQQLFINASTHVLHCRKSNLRNPSKPLLGKQYQALAVSRNRLGASEDEYGGIQYDDEDSDDPFAKRYSDIGEESSEDLKDDLEDAELGSIDGKIPRNEDEEIDSSEAFDEEDAGRDKSFKFRGSKSQPDREVDAADEEDGSSYTDFLSGKEDTKEDGFDSAGDESMSDTSSTGSSVFSENESSIDQEPDSKLKRLQEPSERSALRSLLSSSSTNLASSLSAAAASDAKKGRAVKQQYETFDKLLDLRIKLQKSLTAVNDLPHEPSPITQSETETIRSAEEAALTLYNNLTAVRTQFLNATESSPVQDHAPKRCKLSPPTLATPSTSSSTLATEAHRLHDFALPHRRAILQKWSLKTRATSTTSKTPKLFQNTASSGSDLLTHLEASIISSRPPPPSPDTMPTYDDTTFYQSLLRDLLTHRSSISAFASPAPILPTKLHPSSTAPGKTVDMKASKGRKVRYTAHEKLLNFMAAGDERGSWSEDGRREFFAGLLGGVGMLREDEEEGGEGVDEGGGADIGEGLRLFR